MTESWESEFNVSYVIGDPGLVLGIYSCFEKGRQNAKVQATIPKGNTDVINSFKRTEANIYRWCVMALSYIYLKCWSQR